MRQPNAIMMGRQEIPSNSTQFWCVATRCRVITYVMAAVLPLLLLIVVARFDPELNRSESTDWNSLISRADEALSRGDRYEARRLYVQVDRVAYWRNDWQGLVAAACRINKLDGVNRPYSKSLAVMFRASTIAERGQSRQGLATVAKSLSLLGSDEAASAILARIQPNWPYEVTSADNRSSLVGCSR
jgi:hypothetical protein